MATDPTLSKLQQQATEATQKRQEALIQYNASKATAMENVSQMRKQEPINIENLKRSFAAGGVWSNQMGFQAGQEKQKEDLAIKQAQRGITAGTQVQSLENKVFSEQQGLLSQAIQARKIADQLGVADLSQGELATAFKLGVIDQSKYEAALAALGYGKPEADILAAIAEKQLANSQGTIGGGEQIPTSLLAAEGAPADQVALAKQFGKQYGVDPNLLLAIALHETQFGTLGAGRQGYTLGYGYTDSGAVGGGKYAGVANQYRYAAASLAAHGVHNINDIMAGRAGYYATDPGWEAGVRSAYNSIIAGTANVPKGAGANAKKRDSATYHGTVFSSEKGASISNPDAFIKKYYNDYKNVVSDLHEYLASNPSGTIGNFISWESQRGMAATGGDSTKVTAHILAEQWNFSLAWYRIVDQGYPEIYG